MELSLSNVINIQVATSQTGAGEYNTSNLALFTEEAYDLTSFGTDGYKIYLSPTEVATDFGTDSNTYAMALKVFGQQPNILANSGYLVVIPFVPEVQSVTFSATPTAGGFRFIFGGSSCPVIAYNAAASDAQVSIRTIAGLEGATVTGSITASTSLAVTFYGQYGDIAAMTTSNALTYAAGSSAVVVTVGEVSKGESYATAITRTEGLVQYFGLMATQVFGQVDMLAAAAVIQAANKIGSFVSYTAADVDSGGKLDLLTTGGFDKCRGLFYGDSFSTAIGMMAAYMGRGLSTNFDGSNTTQTMHLKDLIGVQPDPSMTQTLLTKCQDAGADVYVSLQGVPKVFCSGADEFFDYIYGLGWLVGALEIAGFNFLAQTPTKIPQTEAGMDGLKAAYRRVLEQGVTNQFMAPGEWNSPVTFGSQSDFLANIRQRGYYIYSAPLASQSVAARDARVAPLVQIAIKLAGAIHKSNVIVFVNK